MLDERDAQLDAEENGIWKAIKPGIARTFVENIRDWVERVKNTVPVLEVI